MTEHIYDIVESIIAAILIGISVTIYKKLRHMPRSSRYLVILCVLLVILKIIRNIVVFNIFAK